MASFGTTFGTAGRGIAADAAACGFSDLLASCSVGAAFAGSAIAADDAAIEGVAVVLLVAAGNEAGPAGGAATAGASGAVFVAGVGVVADVFNLALPVNIQYAPPLMTRAHTAIPVPISSCFLNWFRSPGWSVPYFCVVDPGGVEGDATPHDLQNLAPGLLIVLHW